MAIDKATFAQECVRQGAYFGANPHYILAVARLRSGISDDSVGDQIGPFRLKQTEWDANSNDDEFEVHFQPSHITSPLRQCAVFALMTHRAFETLAAKAGRNPSALELYVQQWPDAAGATLQADLQKALDDTAALLDPAAAAVLDDPATVPAKIADDSQHDPAPGPVPTQFAGLRDANQGRWGRMQIHQDRIGKLDARAKALVEPTAKARYQAVTAITRVPWYIIAVIHEREASQDWGANIAQGDPWNRRSVNVPAGRGPFASWQDAAVDALVNCAPKAAGWSDWSPGGALTLLERYNGLGYFFKKQPSPYIWSFSDQYVSGKFIRDHVFDAGTVDPQMGCAPLLARMKIIDPSIAI